ncbi:hypothetical protein JCM13664_07330 [Methylothermus subterraneus]
MRAGWIRFFPRWRLGTRSAWFIRWLGLPCFEGPPTAPGLILIQIDGLSLPQLQRALEQKRMPFLQRLIRRGRYCLHCHYPGLPATTPACQGALFYGVHPAVPAFSFRAFGELVRMYQPQAASAVEKRLAESGQRPLLLGGSAYASNFTGGAGEAHFCPAASGWGKPLRGAPSWVLALFILLHLPSFIRLTALLLVELGLAVTDFLRGITEGQDFFKELKFIPTRVGITILLRELAVIGTQLDVARGLPVIYLNFLGYDEQAHRRGPDSRFAHWTLKGIDAAIARIWRAARLVKRRRYQVWIYSDHGQEHVQSYFDRHGRHLDQAVAELLAELGIKGQLQADVGRGIQTQRILWFGGRLIRRLFPVWNDSTAEEGEPPVLAALGPVGHLYLNGLADVCLKTQVARGLVERAQVPLVLARADAAGDKVCAWTAAGKFQLPEQAAEVFGADHPFLDRLGEDWVRLCRHPEAGDLVLVGWCKGALPLSFAIENGAHAGAGPNETSAFALLPDQAPLPFAHRRYLTTFDLRAAALDLLGHG